MDNVPATQHHPIIMCPGLGSSGAYSFDLSPNGEHSAAQRMGACCGALQMGMVSSSCLLPRGQTWQLCSNGLGLLLQLLRDMSVVLCAFAVSLADFLASKGWDVWTCELRGKCVHDKQHSTNCSCCNSFTAGNSWCIVQKAWHVRG